MKVRDTSGFWENAFGVVMMMTPIPELGIVKMLGVAARALSPASRALGRDLVAAGHVRPAGAAAHHIVAGSAARAGPARAVLERFGIGLNDAVNGVFLPYATHAGVHTNAYYDMVNMALGQAGSKAEAMEVLQAIGRGLLP
jgi:hypothetical protein